MSGDPVSREGAPGDRGAEPGRAVRAGAVRTVWLATVWVLLWGSPTPLTVVGGLAVGALVTGAFPVPPVERPLPVRPLRLLALLAYLGYDVLVSGAGVAWQVLRYGPRVRAAVVAVPLLTGSDRVAAVVANALSLSPGTMVLQVDARGGTWYVYALGPRDPAAVERVRRTAMDMQRRVLAALGTAEELAAARAWLARPTEEVTR